MQSYAVPGKFPDKALRRYCSFAERSTILEYGNPHAVRFIGSLIARWRAAASALHSWQLL
jgi:hypothetical protein